MSERNGGGPTQDCGMIKGEEGGSEEGCWLLVRVGLELRVVADSECRADYGERTGPRRKVREAK